MGKTGLPIGSPVSLWQMALLDKEMVPLQSVRPGLAPAATCKDNQQMKILVSAYSCGPNRACALCLLLP